MLARLGLAIFFTMNVMVFALALWSQALYTQELAEPGPFATSLWQLFRYLGLLFSIPVLFLLGGPIVENVVAAVRRGTVVTDVLILVGVAAAYGYSVISVVRGTGHVYFEVACMVLVFMTLGRWLEANGRLKAGAILDSLARLLPGEVRIIRDGASRMAPREQVKVGQLIRVLPGERFAVDGRIVQGRADVDQQILTGESAPVSVGAGQAVYSGTLNVAGDVDVEVTAAVGQETVSRMIQLIRDSRRVAGRYQRAADRLTAWFVPVVCLVAVATAGYHLHATGLEASILSGLAVVLIACPCALGLATPVAIWAGLGRAARAQVLFQSGAALERLGCIRALRFDKTGTLTSGEATVERTLTDGRTGEAELLRVAGGLAASSTHHFASAITDFASKCEDLPHAITVRTVPGRGLVGCLEPDGSDVFLGNFEWMLENQQRADRALSEAIDTTERDGAPLVCVGWGGQVRGFFVMGESLRPEAPAALAKCNDLGIDIAVLTGDHSGRARKIAEQLGLPVTGQQRPKDKVEAVRDAQRQFGTVAMVGDGINDAPALAASDVGVAMGCGADLSRDAAAVCLLTDDLGRLPWAVSLSRLTLRIVRQNLFWAFVYNTAGIALAASGRLNPVWAALAMALSSLLVVTNSLRLTRFPEPEGRAHRPVDVPAEVGQPAGDDHAVEPLMESTAR
jgi:heavy metal translocating P-type ATPase